jgi:hypothetical protein
MGKGGNLAVERRRRQQCKACAPLLERLPWPDSFCQRFGKISFTKLTKLLHEIEKPVSQQL